MKRLLIIVSALAVLLLAAAFVVFNPSLPTPAGETSSNLYQPGTLGLQREPLLLVDSSRTTNANGDFAGAPERSLEGYLWYPTDSSAGPYPLVIYSHGFMSSATEAEYLIEFLVRKGYVVAAVNYPLSNGSAPGGPTVNDVLNQPGDVSFIIDSLLARANDINDPLHAFIDPVRIAAVGLSLGGLTTQLAAFHRDVRDPRLLAAASIAGPAEFLQADFFNTSDTAFLMLAGSADAIIPYQPHAADLPERAAGSMLVTLENGTHVGFAGIATSMMRWFHHPDAQVCPMLLRGLENGAESTERMLSADASLGISDQLSQPCTMTEYPRAMRPGDQQMLTRLTIYAFLESNLALDSQRRQAMSDYLINVVARENTGITVRTSPAN